MENKLNNLKGVINMEIKIICKNWNNLGFDTMIISENNKKVKYVGYTKKEAIKLFKESSINQAL